MASTDVTAAADPRSRTEPWVFDADGHVVEPEVVWDDYLPSRYRSFAPRVLQSDDHFRFVCGDRVGFRIEGRSEAIGAPGQTPKQSETPVAARGGSEPGPRIADMAVDRIGAAALYPTYGLMIQGVTEREPALALCRAVNDWLAEYCSHDRDRLVGVGTLPMTDAGDALAEARRCVEELAFRGVWRRPEHFGTLPRIDDRTYEPLWSYLAEAGVPLAIHPGMSGLVPFDELQGRFDDYFSPLHAAHFVMEQMLALTTFIAYGILERHPGLRVALLESGAVWALSYVHRLDEHLELFGFDRGDLAMRPSDYFRRQCFVAVEEVEPGLAAMLQEYPDSVVFASDYPHADGTFPGSTADLLGAHEVDPVAARRVLRDNALRLYGLDSSMRER
jgi:predicted TIM-barrel fold metal-dependent hydrolase